MPVLDQSLFVSNDLQSLECGFPLRCIAFIESGDLHIRHKYHHQECCCVLCLFCLFVRGWGLGDEKKKEEIQASEASLRLKRRPEGVNPEPRPLRASLWDRRRGEGEERD